MRFNKIFISENYKPKSKEKIHPLLCYKLAFYRLLDSLYYTLILILYFNFFKMNSIFLKKIHTIYLYIYESIRNPSQRSGTAKKYRFIASMNRCRYNFGDTIVGSACFPIKFVFTSDSIFLSNVYVLI